MGAGPEHCCVLTKKNAWMLNLETKIASFFTCLNSPVFPGCCLALSSVGRERLSGWLCELACASFAVSAVQSWGAPSSELLAFHLLCQWGDWDRPPESVCVLPCYRARTTNGSVEHLHLFLFTQVPNKFENASLFCVTRNLSSFLGRQNQLNFSTKISGSVTLKKERWFASGFLF